ncbi:MAG: BACON domain-containing protein, partial [Bacteroidales bacterium]
MKRFNLILAAFAILAVAVGCKPDPVLTLTTASDSAVTFEIPGGTKTITFYANYAWTAASSDSWVTVSPASGNAEAGSITMTAAANTTSSERTATVTITMETLKQTITCKQGAQVLKLSNSDDASWTIGKEEKTIAVDFTSNLDWTAASSVDWITLTPTSGKAATSAAEITLKVAANDTYDDRTGIVTVTSNGKTLGIEVKQSQTNSFAIVDDNDGYYWANQLGGEVDIN